MRHIILGLSFCVFFLMACNQAPEMKFVDLLSYGVPIQIEAPDSVEITTSDMGIQKDLVLQGEGGYNIQTFYSDAVRNQKDADQEHKNILKENPRFKELVLDELKRFIYSMQLDSTLEHYGLLYVVVKGGKEISSQPGMGGVYTQEKVEELYHYAKNIK